MGVGTVHGDDSIFRVIMKHDPQSYARIFGTKVRRQYSNTVQDRTLPNYPIEYIAELRYAAHQWDAFHPWDKGFRARLRKVEETGDARDFGDDYFTLKDAIAADCYQ
jgi:hypothetical protein